PIPFAGFSANSSGSALWRMRLRLGGRGATWERRSALGGLLPPRQRQPEAFNRSAAIRSRDGRRLRTTRQAWDAGGGIPLRWATKDGVEAHDGRRLDDAPRLPDHPG